MIHVFLLRSSKTTTWLNLVKCDNSDELLNAQSKLDNRRKGCSHYATSNEGATQRGYASKIYSILNVSF